MPSKITTIAVVCGLAIILGLAALAVMDHEPSSSVRTTPRMAIPVSPSRHAGRPGDALVAKLRRLGLAGPDWRQHPDGLWNAHLRKAVGGIEVSCKLESSRSNTLERIEVELEVYSSNYTERATDLKDVFRTAVFEVAPDLSEETFASPMPWTEGPYAMEDLPNLGKRRSLKRFTWTAPR